MKKFCFLLNLLVLFFVIASCGGGKEGDNKVSTTNEIQRGEISTDFNLNQFTFGEEESLLKEINACDSTAENDRDPFKPACSPRFFRFFALDDNSSLKNGFMLLIKATVKGSETRKFKIYRREKGTLVLLNGFNGNIIERIKSNSKYDDLVIRFGNRIDNSLHHYNCLFKWNGGRYEFYSCEEIDDRKVLKEFKDSMNVEINSMLEKEHYLF